MKWAQEFTGQVMGGWERLGCLVGGESSCLFSCLCFLQVSGLHDSRGSGVGGSRWEGAQRRGQMLSFSHLPAK